MARSPWLMAMPALDLGLGRDPFLAARHECFGQCICSFLQCISPLQMLDTLRVSGPPRYLTPPLIKTCTLTIGQVWFEQESWPCFIMHVWHARLHCVFSSTEGVCVQKTDQARRIAPNSLGILSFESGGVVFGSHGYTTQTPGNICIL